MGYFSSNEDFQSAEPFGCCDDCRRRRCQLGYAPLAEWYEIDKPEPPPAGPAAAGGRISSAVGEPAPEPPLVLPTQGLLDPPPPPPLPRNLREALARGWPPLRVPFRPSPGPPATPPPPDLRLSPEYQRKLNEKWEREREERKFNRPLPPPRQRASLQEEIDRYIDSGLNPLLDRLRVPTVLRGPIRESARATIGLNAGELLDRSLKQMRLGGETREAIRASIRNVMRQIHTR